jgi:phosphorylase kinase alpha/beta subunit
MIRDSVLSTGQVDPLGRRRHKRPGRPVVQILLLAEDSKLQAELAAHGVEAETLDELAPVCAYTPEEIARAHGAVGRNDRLGLTGRAARALKSLTTSRFYEINNSTVLCLAPFFSQRDFYLTYDLEFLVERFKSELTYLRRHWSMPGRPTVTLLLTRGLLETDKTPLFELMSEVRRGQVGDVPVHQCSLVNLLPSAAFERLDIGLLDPPLVHVDT